MLESENIQGVEIPEVTKIKELVTEIQNDA